MSIDPITAVSNLATSVVNRIWADPDKQAEEHRKIAELAANGDTEELNAHVKLLVGQMEVNKVEAASENLFKSGWRPAVGWVCGFGLLYASTLDPLMRFVAKMYGYEGVFPVVDTTITLQVLTGMLGLGLMRSREKEKGVSS